MARDPVAEWRRRSRVRNLAARLSFLRWIEPPAAKAPVALSICLGGTPYELNMHAWLAVALKQRGLRPVILIDSHRDTAAKRHFTAFGLTDFVALADFTVDRATRASCDQAAQRMLAADLDFPTVKAWMWRGAWIGPQVLSSIGRAGHMASPDPRDPAVRQKLRDILPALLARVVAAEALVKALNPVMGLTIEANYTWFGPIVDKVIEHGGAVIQFVQPWRDDAMVFKRLTARTRRMHPSSVDAATLAAAMTQSWGWAEDGEVEQLFNDRYGGRWVLQGRNQPEAQAVSPTQILSRLGLDPAKPVATVFSHVLWDANLFYGEDLFTDYGDWFIQTVKAAVANPHVNWIIKLHPANLWKRAAENVVGEYAEAGLIRDHIGQLPPHVVLLPPDCGISTLSLFELSSWGVTVRGTVGMELPCFGKRCFTAGSGRYSGLGFTEDSADMAEYLAKMASIQNFGPLPSAAIALARRHFLTAFRDRLWPMQSMRLVFSPTGPADPKAWDIVPVAESLEQVAAFGDLAAFARWAADSDGVDYLHEGGA